MRAVAAAAALCAALALLPAVQACSQATDGPSFTVNNVGTLPYAGNVSVPVTAEVGCAALLAAASAGTPGAATVPFTIVASPAPSYLTVSGGSLSFDPSKCVGGASAGCAATSGTLGFAVTPAAPGVDSLSVNLTGSLPKPQTPTPYSATQSVAYNVSFHAAYNLTASIPFPAKADGKYLNFTVTVKVDNNARSMVMIENLHATAGSVSGLASVVYMPGETKTFHVTFMAPEGGWTSSNVTFHEYTHYLLNGTATGLAGGANDPHDVRWRIDNANPGTTDDAKKSPMGGWPLVLTVLGSALLARLRRAD